MNVVQVALGTGFLILAIARFAEVQRFRSRPPEQRRQFKNGSLRGPALAGVFWLLLAAWWLGRGLLA